MEIKCVKDYEKYVFKNNDGLMWICRTEGIKVYYKVIYGSEASLGWRLWYNASDKSTFNRATKLIHATRKEMLEEYTPIIFKIKEMEQRFKERMKHA